MLFEQTQTSRFTWLIDLCGLALFLFIFYMLWLGHYPLFTPDEGRYSEVAREMVVTGDYITPKVNGAAFMDKPILYYWLQAIGISLFGIKEWALRFFPALMGIIGCLCCYVFGRYLFNRRTGLFAALILATTPLYFGNAHYANLDVELAVFVSGSLFCLLAALIRTDSKRTYFILGAFFFAALAFLTKGLIGIVFPLAIGGSWMLCMRRFDLLKQTALLGGIVLFLILILPWYLLVQKANPAFLHYFFITQQVTRFLSTTQFNNQQPFWFYLPIIAIGFFPWTIFLIQTLYQSIRSVWQKPQNHLVELFLLLWSGIIFLFFSFPHSKIVGYILPIFPPLALLTAHYLSNIWNQCEKNSLNRNRLFFVIATVFFAVLPFTFTLYPRAISSAALMPIFIMAAFIFIGSALLCIFIKTKNIKPLFFLCISSNVLFLLLLVWNAASLNQRSTKILTQQLSPILRMQDEIVTYHQYYYDVPLYLNRYVTVVANWRADDIAHIDNWQRELWLGQQFQPLPDWFIEEDAFWKRWHGSHRLFVFLHEKDLSAFKAHTRTYFFIGKNKHIIVLSNSNREY